MAMGIIVPVVTGTNALGFVGDGVSTTRDVDLTGYIDLSGVRPKLPTAAFVTTANAGQIFFSGASNIAFTVALVGAVLTFTFASAPPAGAQGFVQQIDLAF